MEACAVQLAEVFTDIVNLTLTLETIPACLKSAIVVPLQKETNISNMNDYRPITLTLTTMKCFERLLLSYIKVNVSTSLDSNQFAHRTNRSF